MAKVLVAPDASSAGRVVNTTTCSAVGSLSSGPSLAMMEIARAVVFVLVVENVTDSKAAWYWAGVALPLKVSTPPE